MCHSICANLQMTKVATDLLIPDAINIETIFISKLILMHQFEINIHHWKCHPLQPQKVNVQSVTSPH